jgi:hypothetical protein
MRRLIAAVSLLLAAGCTSTGAIAPDAQLRAANFLACNAQLALKGFALSQGMGAAEMIATIGAAGSDPVVSQACSGVLQGLQQDIEGAKAKVDGLKK